MGELILGAPVAGLVSRNRITEDDVRMLRGEVFRDGVVTRPEAEALFALDLSCADKCAGWTEFFVEAVSDYLVAQEPPHGYVSEDNAAWLVRAISRDGKVDTGTEMELLVRIIEKATSAPASLSAFALKQVALAIVDGDGPLAGGRTLTRGVIGAAEVEMLRRILYGFSGDGSSAITRAEAEVLFDLNDRTVEARNDPSWNDLFVKAVASFLMAASGYRAPSREEALRCAEWLGDTDVNLGGFFSRMFAGGLKGYATAIRSDHGSEAGFRRANEARAEAAADSEAVNGDEARWLAHRIGRDGVLHGNEKALLRYLRQESPALHPDLRPLLDKVA